MIDSMADRIESRVRRAWESGPGPGLRAAAAGYAAVAGLRNLLYDAAVLAPRGAPLPVLSVGGLTIGGSGKTPVTADLASRLAAAGARVAILTHGYPDEMGVHRRLCPEARVYGGSDRVRLARKAREEGSDIAIVDSGFQYRRLRRDLELVVVEEEEIRARPRYLPAGPYREGLGSVARADYLVLVRREGASTPAPRHPTSRHTSLPAGPRLFVQRVAAAGGPPVLRVRIRSETIEAANDAALDRAANPALAVAGVMWPDRFFRQARAHCPGIRDTVALRDHAPIGPARADALARRAGAAGVICTLKDAARLTKELDDSIPVWVLRESVHWDDGNGQPEPIRAALALLPAGGREDAGGGE